MAAFRLFNIALIMQVSMSGHMPVEAMGAAGCREWKNTVRTKNKHLSFVMSTNKLIAFVLVVLFLAAPAYGQNKKQMEREKAKIEKEIARLTSELSKAKKNTKNSTAQIQLIKKRINERNRLIDNINGQMNMLDRQIVRTEDSIKTVRSQLDSMKAEYAHIVNVLYGLSYNVNPSALLYDSENYNISYLKLKYFNEYSRYRRHQATMIQRKQQLFEDMTLDLQRQKNEKKSLLAQEKKQKDALSREQQKHQSNLNKSQQDEKQLAQQIKKKEQQRRQLQQQIQQMVSAEVAKSSGSSSSGKGKSNVSGSTEKPGKVYSDAASADFVKNKGKLPWPVYYKSVSQEYGLVRRESGGENRSLGIFLNCTPGASVRAVFDGTVVAVKTSPYGKGSVIMVKHGSYLTVYAGVDNVTVKSGSKVTGGQTIGKVTQGEESTSEFAFMIWCNQVFQNPRHWLN